jgi:hypothetical protein
MVEIVSLKTLATERFNSQAQMIQDLKAQLAKLNDALGDSPARISQAAIAAERASDSLTQRVSTIEAYVSRMEGALKSLQQNQPQAPEKKE